MAKDEEGKEEKSNVNDSPLYKKVVEWMKVQNPKYASSELPNTLYTYDEIRSLIGEKNMPEFFIIAGKNLIERTVTYRIKDGKKSKEQTPEQEEALKTRMIKAAEEKAEELAPHLETILKQKAGSKIRYVGKTGKGVEPHAGYKLSAEYLLLEDPKVYLGTGDVSVYVREAENKTDYPKNGSFISFFVL